MVVERIPCIVRGVVTRHEPYGFFVDIKKDQDGLVVVTMICDDSGVSNPDYPRIGSEIDAVLLGYTQIGNQPRLSVRQSDLEAIAPER